MFTKELVVHPESEKERAKNFSHKANDTNRDEVALASVLSVFRRAFP
jgi:hypothetical protein